MHSVAPIARPTISHVILLSLVALSLRIQPVAADDVERLIFRGPRLLSQLQETRKLQSHVPGETTFVGYNPAYAGPDNPWQIGVGAYRPFAGSNNARRGYWDWDTPINGDSLQGWWPMRHPYTLGGTSQESAEPARALEHGNGVNYVINQGQKRTFGVVGVWHADPGGITTTLPGTNPKPPNIVVSGTRAAWCGLRGHGDRTAIDGVTGNPITAEAIPFSEVSVGSSAGGTGRRLPGYIGSWDQFMYRDVNISARGNNPLRVRFKLRTRMSTNYITSSTGCTGWTQWDPTSVTSPNFISGCHPDAPRDSFMVYVGKPVEPVAGLNNDYVNAAGQSRDLYDPLRRWFSEIVRIDGTTFTGRANQIYGCAGNVNDGVPFPDDGFATIDCGLGDAQLDPMGNTVRLVFRNKTNRSVAGPSGNSDDETGSYNGTYNSGYGGAAIVDDIQISLDNGGVYITVGDFEEASGPGSNIDNSVAATVSWRTTGKPPAIYAHVRDVSTINYQDVCGELGSDNRQCNLWGNVLSTGEFPNDQKAGAPGTVDFERWESIRSPTICLATSGPSTPNHMGITGDMANASDGYYILYDWNFVVGSSLPNSSSYFRELWQSYPAQQEDGTRCWSDLHRYAGIIDYDGGPLCYTTWSDNAIPLIYTTNASGIPDSIRFVLKKQTYCYRFNPGNCGNPIEPWAYDNVTFAMVDAEGPQTALKTSWASWMQDAFPANENASLIGTAAFDTCAAWAMSGVNTANYSNPYPTIVGDSVVVDVSSGTERLDVVFRILPGPGNFVMVGNPSSGLRRIPTSPAAIAPGDSSFWTSYLEDNGPYGTPGGHPAGPFATRWSALVWNSARCDTADVVRASVSGRGWGGSPDSRNFAGTYHESELAGSRARLAVPRNLCFLDDTLGALTSGNVNCGRAVEGFGAYPPAWVGVVPSSRTGYATTAPGWPKTTEGTKIFPDGLFTPGTHVQYFYRKLGTDESIALSPDTSRVLQGGAWGEQLDGERWRSWAVLPDAWKKPVYGGLGEACLLYIDWNDGSGEERAWVSVADSIGATQASKFGAHNGWHASGAQVLSADVNDPAGFFRDRNGQPGTTWDMYQVAAQSAGSPGSRSTATLTGLAAGKEPRNAPTVEMLGRYPMLLATTASWVNVGTSSYTDVDDRGTLRNYLLSADSLDVRGLMIFGNSFIESIDPGPGLDSQLQTLLAADLVYPSYRYVASNPYVSCSDLRTLEPISTNDDIYGLRTSCYSSFDVLSAAPGGSVVARYADGFAAAVSHPVNPGSSQYWFSVVTGFDLANVRGQFCSSSFGRLRFTHDLLAAFQDAIGASCSLTGDPAVTLDTPQSGGGTISEFVALHNNPLRQGDAVVRFGLAKADRVTLRFYDVAGRRIRTLLDRQAFGAGEWEITWDGRDDEGHGVPRGVYFASFEGASGSAYQRKVTVLK